MGLQLNSVEVIVLGAGVGLVTSAITAFVTVRLQMYQERARWQKDFALKLAEFQSTNRGQAEKVAQQFAIGVLLLDEGENADIPRKREFIPFYGCLVVGTDSSNDIVVKEDLCSSKHLLFFASQSDVYALDLKSQNGTWVNGKRLTRSCRLAHGDEITLADRRSTTRITFVAIDRGRERRIWGLRRRSL
jgi:pSer/pThr/pTyr-binding forkhead associated (FHA) protein